MESSRCFSVDDRSIFTWSGLKVAEGSDEFFMPEGYTKCGSGRTAATALSAMCWIARNVANAAEVAESQSWREVIVILKRMAEKDDKPYPPAEKE